MINFSDVFTKLEQIWRVSSRNSEFWFSKFRNKVSQNVPIIIKWNKIIQLDLNTWFKQSIEIRRLSKTICQGIEKYVTETVDEQKYSCSCSYLLTYLVHVYVPSRNSLITSLKQDKQILLYKTLRKFGTFTMNSMECTKTRLAQLLIYRVSKRRSRQEVISMSAILIRESGLYFQYQNGAAKGKK